MTATTQILTIKLRLRDKHSAELNRQARAVNFVWNYCNETQRKAVGYGRQWLTGFDLGYLTAGSSKDLGLNSKTIEAVCAVYARTRQAQRRPWLRWRGRRSLGWIPFGSKCVRFNGKTLKFRDAVYEPMHLRAILGLETKLRSGSFNQDARGRWYVNLTIEVLVGEACERPDVGVDLGLKALATLSNGDRVEVPRLYRASEAALAMVQRARKTRRMQSISRKVANRRKDFLHKASRKLATEFGLIVVGDVSPSQLARTRMAKSIYDAGWASLKTMISYKAVMHGGRMLEVNEAYSSQICSACGSLPPSRPRGIADLGIREWRCDDCETVHDRDVNAARNILRLGQQTLAEGALRLAQQGAAKSFQKEAAASAPLQKDPT